MRDEGYYFITLLHFKIWSSNFEVQMLHVTHWTQHAAQSLGRLGWSVQPRLLVQIILSCAYCVQMGVKNLLTLWHDSCLRTKKGLQGGKTIQQRSEFALQWSLMLLPALYIHACVLLSAHTRVSICYCYYSSLVGCHNTVPFRSWNRLLRHARSHRVTRLYD